MCQVETIRDPYLGIFVNHFCIRTDEADILVDTGLAPAGGKTPEGPAADTVVLSTHGHWDHIGAHRLFQERGAKIFAHPSDKRYYSDFDWHWKVLFGQFKNDFDLPPERKTTFWSSIGRPVSPDRWLSDGEEFSVGGVRIRALHTPGHSAGSMCYLLPDDGILFTGDTLMGNGFFGGIPQYMDAAAYLASMEKLSKLTVDTVYCDHHAEKIDGKLLPRRAEESVGCMERIRKSVGMFAAGYRGKAEDLLKNAVARVCGAEGKNPGGGACVTVLTHLNELAAQSEKALRCAKRYSGL